MYITRTLAAVALLGLTVGTTRVLCAQDGAPTANATRSGIYLSADAFSRGDLTLAIDCKTQQHKIDLHSFWSRSYIDVDHNGKSQRFQKRDIFGYRDCEQRDARFYKGEEYRVMEAGPIAIYTKEERAPSGKASNTPILAHYFSTSPAAPITRLTRERLNAAYPDNHRFHDLLSSTFHNDTDLGNYDAQHKMYGVNHAFTQAQ